MFETVTKSTTRQTVAKWIVVKIQPTWRGESHLYACKSLANHKRKKVADPHVIARCCGLLTLSGPDKQVQVFTVILVLLWSDKGTYSNSTIFCLRKVCVLQSPGIDIPLWAPQRFLAKPRYESNFSDFEKQGN